MTKAQEVRIRRLQKYKAAIAEEAQKIFDWILDLMDANTEKGYLGSLDVYLYYDEQEIKVKCQEKAKYNLAKVLLQYDRVKNILLRTEQIKDMEDMDAVYERLESIYDKLGDKEKSKEFAKKWDEYVHR